MSKEQIRKLSFICAAVALAVVIIAVIIVFFTREPQEEEPGGAAGPSRIIPEGMRLVEDIYAGELIDRKSVV